MALSPVRRPHASRPVSRHGFVVVALIRSVPAIALVALSTGIHGSGAEEPAPAAITVWEMVYTEAQAMRGRDIYAAPCGRCHGKALDGAPDDPDMFPAPPIAGWKFLRNWDGRSLGTLYEYIRTTMPANNPGFLAKQEFIDLLAYMLWMSDAPAGARELPIAAAHLDRIVIRPRQ